MAKEADELLFHHLREAGCSVPEGIKSAESITSPVLTTSVASCLNIIGGSKKFKTKMPKGLAARHRLCTAIAKEVKGMSYTGDCSFNTFLYPNEKDSRAILLFLVENLPKSEDDEEEEVVATDPKALLSRNIIKVLKSWGKVTEQETELFLRSGMVKSPASVHSVPLSLVGNQLHAKTANPSKTQQDYYDNHMKFVGEQPANPVDMSVSLFELNARDVSINKEQQEQTMNMEGGATKQQQKRKMQQIHALLRASFAGAENGADDNILGSASDKGGLNGVMGNYKASVGGVNGGSNGVDGQVGSSDSRFVQETAFTGGDEEAGSGGKPGSGGVGSSKVDEKSVEEQEAAWDKEIEKLQSKVEGAERKMANDKKAAEDYIGMMRQIESLLLQELSKTEGLERTYLVKKRTLEMVPEANSHMAKLQKICQQSVKGLMQLGADWEKHRRPLINKLRALKESIAQRKAACKGKVADMKRMRTEMRTMATDLRSKEKQLRVLMDDWKRLPKTVDRSSYTERIMEIIKQVHKQKADIRAIIRDIHDVQVDTNSVSQKLLRTEAVADERIFKQAEAQKYVKKKNPAIIKAYKDLLHIRQHFEDLVAAVDTKGKLTAETATTEARTVQLKARGIDQNMEQLLSDLQQVKDENAGLKKKIGKLKK